MNFPGSIDSKLSGLLFLPPRYSKFRDRQVRSRTCLSGGGQAFRKKYSIAGRLIRLRSAPGCSSNAKRPPGRRRGRANGDCQTPNGLRTVDAPGSREPTPRGRFHPPPRKVHLRMHQPLAGKSGSVWNWISRLRAARLARGSRLHRRRWLFPGHSSGNENGQPPAGFRQQESDRLQRRQECPARTRSVGLTASLLAFRLSIRPFARKQQHIVVGPEKTTRGQYGRSRSAGLSQPASAGRRPCGERRRAERAQVIFTP